MSERDIEDGLPDGRRPPWSELRAELQALGFRPSKTLGQNFLIDPNAARSIANDARIQPGQVLLEVGAGCGFLTQHLSRLGGQVLAVEIDPRLLGVARRLLERAKNVRWLLADALEGKHVLASVVRDALPSSGAWQLVSNLPYSISAPLLVVLSRLPNPPEHMTVLVQEEVAQRLAARPGGSEWGPLAARLGLLYEAQLGRAVGPQLFWPRPRVASRVVRLSARGTPMAGPEDLPEYDFLVDALFQHRRKQLLATLAERLGDRKRAEDLAQEVGLDPQQRPGALDPGQLLALSRSSAWRGRPRGSPP